MRTCGWGSSRPRTQTLLPTQRPRTGSRKNYNPQLPLGAHTITMATKHSAVNQGIRLGYRETGHTQRAQDRNWIWTAVNQCQNLCFYFGAQIDNNMALMIFYYYYFFNCKLVYQLQGSVCAWDLKGILLLPVLYLTVFFSITNRLNILFLAYRFRVPCWGCVEI